MGSATKFLCFCEVVDILRMVLWCLECSAKGRHHTDICAKRSHTGERTVHKRAIEIFNEIFKSSIGGWLAPRSLQLGTWSAGYSYAEVLWMQQEPTSRLECRSESILQGTFKKYPLVSNPRELLIATGSKTAAERHLKEFYREMILNNFYVMCVAWFINISNYIFYTKC